MKIGLDIAKAPEQNGVAVDRLIAVAKEGVELRVGLKKKLNLGEAQLAKLKFGDFAAG